MNKFYFFVGRNIFCEPIVEVYKVLKKNDLICSRLIDLVSCNQSDRNIANALGIESSPCLVICNSHNEILEKYYGASHIISKIDFLYSKYGI